MHRSFPPTYELRLLSHMGSHLNSRVFLGGGEDLELLSCYIDKAGGRVVTYLKYPNDGTLISSSCSSKLSSTLSSLVLGLRVHTFFDVPEGRGRGSQSTWNRQESKGEEEHMKFSGKG